MAKVFVKTYGCQMNVRDSEQVISMFKERGYHITDLESEADILLLNTCSIRDQAENKAIGKMGFLAKKNKNLKSKIYAYMGCMAQSKSDELLKTSPHVSLVIGTQKYHKVVDYVEEVIYARGLTHILNDNFVTNFDKNYDKRMDDLRSIIVDVEEETNSQNTIKDHVDLTDYKSDTKKIVKPAEFVSIMQGCNMKCSYCIVPDTRGNERSRPIADILEEINNLVSKGVKQVTLLGQIVNLYGRFDIGKINNKSPFVYLLEQINNIQGLERLRFISPHPEGFDDELVNCFSSLDKLASHIHLPLQSGSDSILKKMKRSYTVDEFKTICKKLRDARNDIAITTDVIVGYPGESEDDFLATKKVIEDIVFDNAFVFRYSSRKGTRAANIDKKLHISDEVKKLRNQELLHSLSEISSNINKNLMHKTVKVLCEGKSRNNPDRFEGRNSQNKIVIFDSKRNDSELIGKMIDLEICDYSNFTLYGKMI